VTSRLKTGKSVTFFTVNESNEPTFDPQFKLLTIPLFTQFFHPYLFKLIHSRKSFVMEKPHPTYCSLIIYLCEAWKKNKSDKKPRTYFVPYCTVLLHMYCMYFSTLYIYTSLLTSLKIPHVACDIQFQEIPDMLSVHSPRNRNMPHVLPWMRLYPLSELHTLRIRIISNVVFVLWTPLFRWGVGGRLCTKASSPSSPNYKDDFAFSTAYSSTSFIE
jgi:hypothetical protein